MSTVTTRIATLDDLPVVAPLFDAYRQFYEQPSDLRLATAFLRDRMERQESVVLLAEDGDRLALGFCQLYPSFCSLAAAPIYVLFDLYVRPEARCCGAAKALLEFARERAERDGRVRMDLTTAKTNLPAQALYESLGWVRDEVFYAYSRHTGR
ncbi:GNAT family N-acetyltransferase [Aquabacterium sp. A7-Y]|uniref:GNAT family N-acetyltransferase n=1 Tax=Aquabacterium sp. A7-Y TaxID=1349605 RepID=UPI00223DAFB0|nr:GNAT family N-acetyltransferase [Aquabacterium sp. A7-Y]MCW7539626.1 GNAT family N-acetyltransferase [Aquabacterium sp. A7-Y]